MFARASFTLLLTKKLLYPIDAMDYMMISLMFEQRQLMLNGIDADILGHIE